MKTGIFRHIFAAAAIAFPGLMMQGQRITESVTVEGRYTPEIIPADRLALLPSAITLQAPESPMNYDRKGVAASFAPDALSMEATGWRARKAYDTSKGYIDLRLGSWLNSSLSAGYAAISEDDTRLNVYLQHNSTSLWQAWKGDPETGRPAADRRFRYDETIGADLNQRLYGYGMLSATLQYHLGYFNYYGTDNCEEEDGRYKAPTQTLNDVYARVAWTGETQGDLKYTAQADVRYFGYRSMYMPLYTAQSPRKFARVKGARETMVNAGGELSYNIGGSRTDGAAPRSAIGIGLLYSGVINAIGNEVNRGQATPAYTLTGRDYSLRVGASLAVAGNGESTRFRAAPDVRFAMRKGLLAFSASAGGGTHLRTLAWLHEMDYYSNPGIGCYEAAYTPLDLRLAFRLNPGGRWTFGLEGEWRTTRDETFGGLYQTFLNSDMNASSYTYYPQSGRIKGFSIGVDAGYEFCRYLSLKGKASWQPQDGEKGILNGFDRPELTADLSAESRPIDRLSLSLDYRVRARRRFGLGRLSALDLTADYRMTERISLGVELRNLLNRHQEYLPGLAMEGFNAMGGVQVKF